MTVKADEIALWNAVCDRETPRAAGQRLGIHPKRVRYLCAKWSKRCIYEYGVAVDLGWASRVILWNLRRADDGCLVYDSAPADPREWVHR